MAFVFHTCNPIDVLKFGWEIENFSWMPRTIRGPPFHPFPDCLEKWCIQLEFGKFTVEVFFVRLDAVLDQFSVKANVTLYDVSKKRICFSDNGRIDISPGETRDLRVSCYFSPGVLNELLEDKLRVMAEITVGNHRIYSKVDAVPALPALAM